MTNNTEQVITAAADKLLQAIAAYGPKATEVVLETGRIAAMQEIVSGFVFLLVFLIVSTIGVFCIRKLMNLPKYDDEKVGWGFGTVSCGIIAVISLIGSLIGLVNVVAWIGIKHPEIYLATKLLKL